ncbi:extracellular solute-binding protein [Catenulispora subtropica]|uniref:Extracellular solute-binding protein n=1 Tax=Catenulispora subtropica TaxID=450798 RepID=A0ABP5D407_9ACTN
MVAVVLAIASVLAPSGCAGSADGAGAGRITLKVRLFGTFGYQEAGLFDAYMARHPDIRIEYSTIQDSGQYWTALQTSLSTESGLGDLQGIEVSEITDATANMADSFVDLGPLGASALRDQFYPWKWAQGLTPDGKVLGLGTDIGPEAMCYRRDLFAKAGLPTARADVAALWKNGWDGYVAAGERFRAAGIPGSAWTDTASGMFNAMIGQSPEQYYDASGRLIYDRNPAVATAWGEAMKIAAGGLSARLTQFTPAWNQAFTSGQFATVACPSWMIGYIKSQTGSLDNRWDVTTAPGGTGNWGGSYLAVPKASKHQQQAADLAIWLASAPQQVAVFEKTGNFPSNRIAAADPAVRDFSDTYFGAVGDPAPIGRIFGDAAGRLPAAVLGARDQVVKDLITKGGITRVEAQGQDPAKSWAKVVRDVTAATG